MRKALLQAPAALPETEAMGLKMARLYPKHAAFERSGSNMAPWLREDAAAIAAAIGLYEAVAPAPRRIPALLLRFRGWPGSLSRDEVQELRRAVTTLLTQHVVNGRPDVPAKFLRAARAAIESGAMPFMALTEMAQPVNCGACSGSGRVRGDRCETCAGSGDGNIGFRRAAERLRISAHQWKTYGREPYGRVLAALRYMADTAGKGVLEALG